MGEFGWAYISGSAPLQSAGGVSGSIQYATPDSRLGGSSRLRYKGELDRTVQSILGGMRSACSYVGAKKLKDLQKSTTFIRVTQTTNEIFTGSENI